MLSTRSTSESKSTLQEVGDLCASPLSTGCFYLLLCLPPAGADRNMSVRGSVRGNGLGAFGNLCNDSHRNGPAANSMI